MPKVIFMASEHDLRYKNLFSHPVLVRELLESFVCEDFVAELDFSTLNRLDKSFATDEFKEKESDVIYSVSFRENPIYIFILIEFQSSVDSRMSGDISKKLAATARKEGLEQGIEKTARNLKKLGISSDMIAQAHRPFREKN